MVRKPPFISWLQVCMCKCWRCCRTQARLTLAVKLSYDTLMESTMGNAYSRTSWNWLVDPQQLTALVTTGNARRRSATTMQLLIVSCLGVVSEQILHNVLLLDVMKDLPFSCLAKVSPWMWLVPAWMHSRKETQWNPFEFNHYSLTHSIRSNLHRLFYDGKKVAGGRALLPSAQGLLQVHEKIEAPGRSHRERAWIQRRTCEALSGFKLDCNDHPGRPEITRLWICKAAFHSSGVFSFIFPRRMFDGRFRCFPKETCPQDKISERLKDVSLIRSRVFMIAYKHNEVEWTAPWTLSSFMALLRSQVKMTAHDYYCVDAPKDKLTDASVSCIYTWEGLTSVLKSLPHSWKLKSLALRSQVWWISWLL